MSIKASAEITLVRVDDGAAGESIDVVSTQYKAGSSPTSAPSGTWSNSVVAVPEGQYLWTRTLFSDGKLLYSVAKQGEKGEPGEPGNDGDSGIIVSPTAPESPKVGQLWQTATGEPIKRWTGTAWVTHYISAENLQAEVLSAITANLGTVTAGIIKSISGDTVINVNDGTIVTHSGISNPSEEITSLEIGKGKFSASRKNTNTNLYSATYGGESIDFKVDGQKRKGLNWSYNAGGGYVDLVSGWSTLDPDWNPEDDFPIIENLKKLKAAVSAIPTIKAGNISILYASASIMRGTVQVGQEWNGCVISLTAKMIPGTPYGGSNLWNVVGTVNNGVLTIEANGAGFVSGHVLGVDYVLMR